MQVWAQLLLHEARSSNNAAALPEAIHTSGKDRKAQRLLHCCPLLYILFSFVGRVLDHKFLHVH